MMLQRMVASLGWHRGESPDTCRDYHSGYAWRADVAAPDLLLSIMAFAGRTSKGGYQID
jgi:hypothetical protein